MTTFAAIVASLIVSGSWGVAALPPEPDKPHTPGTPSPPTVGEDAPKWVKNFLVKRGPGIHHLAWRVDDLVDAIAKLKAAGVKMIDDEPKPGSHGTKVAFAHPKATGGVLMELVEDPNWSAH